ncbi:hypothetical protein BGZ82_004621, partial [Podila clonocystis]
MELEGGLCLLSRLKKLEHLKLQSSAVVDFSEADLGWLGAGNARGVTWVARDVLGSTWGQRIQDQLVLLQNDNIQIPQDDLHELTVPDFNKVGWVEDVQDCLNELALLTAQWEIQQQDTDCAQRRKDPNVVWPSLEFFGFRFPPNRQVSQDQVLKLKEIFRKYRPAVELDIQQ